MRRLAEIARGTENVFRGLDVIMSIGGGHFAGLIAALHPLPRRRNP